MTKITNRFLKRNKCVYFIGNRTHIYRSIFKIGPYFWLACSFKNFISSIKFFRRVFSNFGKEEAKCNITFTKCFIVFILQPCVGNGIKKIFPLNYFKIDILLVQPIILFAYKLPELIS